MQGRYFEKRPSPHLHKVPTRSNKVSHDKPSEEAFDTDIFLIRDRYARRRANVSPDTLKARCHIDAHSSTNGVYFNYVHLPGSIHGHSPLLLCSLL
jgi:hypothetical protein